MVVLVVVLLLVLVLVLARERQWGGGWCCFMPRTPAAPVVT